MALIGLKNFYYAGMTEDEVDGSDTSVQYAEPVRIVGINSVDINPTINNADLFGDDSPIATANSLGRIEVTIDIADIPLKDLAFLLGHSYDSDTNVMKASGDDKAPYVAIMFESEKHDGSTRYVKLLKGRFADSQETINTKGDSIEFQIPQITGAFVTRTADKQWKRTCDSNASNTSVTSDWYRYVDGSDTTITPTSSTTYLGQ